MTHRLRILHVSDLHERVALDSMDDERKRRIELGAASRYRVLDESSLYDRIAELRADGPIDLVCFTGDIADWGLAEEYAAASGRIRRILDACATSVHALFVVPGNHDVDRSRNPTEWKEFRDFTTRYAAEVGRWMAAPHSIPLGAKAEWREAVLRRSENFWNWVANDLKRTALSPAASAHHALGYRNTVAVRDLPFPVHVIGLDSAWLAGDNHDKGMLRLTAEQIRMLVHEKAYPLKGFRLALVHHPLADLADQIGATHRLSERVDLLLHGHQHEALAMSIADPQRSLPVLAAGSLYEGDHEDRYDNAFQCIDVTLDDTGRPLAYDVTFLAWSERGHWHRSSAFYHTDSNGKLHVDVPHRKPATADDRTGTGESAKLPASRWLDGLHATPLWRSVSHAPLPLARRINVLVLRAQAIFDCALERVPDERWRDAESPLRVLHRLDILLGNGEAQLSPAEAALTCIAPFVYEAVLAAGQVMLAAEGDPLDPLRKGDNPGAKPAWSALRNAIRSEEATMSRRERLVQRDMLEAAQDLSGWQLNQFLHSSGELWDFVPQAGERAGGWINKTLDELFAPSPAPDEQDDRIRQIINGRRVVQLSRFLFASSQEIELARAPDRANRLLDEVRVGDSPDEWRLREPLLAHLVSIAAAMEADPRRLDPVLIEHVGMSSGLVATSLRRQLRSITWNRVGQDLVMNLHCEHEAIDFAAQHLVESLERHNQKLKETDTVGEPLRSALPAHFTDKGILPMTDRSGRPVYRRPHLQVTLDQGRILHLLMGTSLYGNPELALRELYQNALDACRLRRARVAYLKASGERIDDYAGRIIFETGVFEGRAFVQCEDNGIGMGERHLRSFFAQGGRRFSDSHEFHVEKAIWNERGIQFFANSRFGIGVFSYFMVADELMVQSKRLGLNGEDWEAGVRAHIVGGSSLFRIQHADDVRGGTLVRLYLRDPHIVHDLTERILDWLWLPEVEVVFKRPDQSGSRLKAGQPTPGFVDSVTSLVPVQQSLDERGHARVFWVVSPRLGMPQSYGLLVDGIRTNNASQSEVPHAIVNLNDDLAPDLTVDRSRVTSWEKGFSYIASLIRQGAWRELCQLPELDLISLEEMFRAWPLPLLPLDKAWRCGEIGQIAPALQTDSYDLNDDTQLHRLARASLGVAPALDALILNLAGLRVTFRNERHGSDVEQDEPTDANWRLADSVHGAAFARLIAARALALEKAGVKLLGQYPLLAQFAHENNWRDQPTLGLILLQDHLRAPANGSLKILVAELLKISHLWSLRLDEVATLARHLAPLEILLPDLERFPENAVLTQGQTSLLKAVFGATPWSDSIALGAVIAASIAIAMPLDEVSTVARELADFGMDVPCPLPDTSGLALTEQHQLLLSTDLSRSGPWLDTLSLQHLLSAENRLHIPLDRVHALASQLVALGIEAPDLSSFLQDSRQRTLLSLELDGQSPWHDSLSGAHIVAAAVKWSTSLAEAAEVAQKLGKLGVALPQIADPLPSFIPDQRSLTLTTSRWYDIGDNDPSRVSLARVLRAAASWTMRVGDVLALARPLMSIGVQICEVPDCAGDFVPEARHLMLLSVHLDAAAIDTSVIPSSRLVCAAIEWRLSVREVIELVRPLAGLGIAIRYLDDIATACPPTPMQALLISRNLDAGPPWLTWISAGHVLEARVKLQLDAQEVAQACHSLAAMGFEVADLNHDVARPVPTRLVQLLSEDLDGKSPWAGKIDAERVLRASVLWHKPIGYIVDMARPYGVLEPALCQLDSSLAAFEPEQRHLDLMSADLNGPGPHVTALPVGHLLKAGLMWAISLRQVYELAKPLVQLGLASLPELSPAQQDFAHSERHVFLLSADLDGRAPWVEKFSPAHLFEAARKLSWPLSNTLNAAARLQALGIAMPANGVLAFEKSERASQLLDSLHYGQRRVCAWNIVDLAILHHTDVLDYAQALPLLVEMDVDVSDALQFVSFCGKLGPARPCLPGPFNPDDAAS